jgi:predicted PurR-regulated permease PerM
MFLLDARAARVTWTVIVFATGLVLLYLLRTPILLFVFSLFFAYLIFPLVRVVAPRSVGWRERGSSCSCPCSRSSS